MSQLTQRRQQAYDRAITSMMNGMKPRRYVNKMRSDMRKLWNEELQRLIELGLDPFDYAENGLRQGELTPLSPKGNVGKSMFADQLKLKG